MSEQVKTQVRAQTTPAQSATPLLQRAAITPVAHNILQRCSNGVECPECRASRLQREGSLQRAAVNVAPTPAVPPIVHDVLASPGQPLGAETRAYMEPRFGHDFSSVRVHTDARAAESARSVNALVYTVGRDVVFGTGQYTPETMTGKRLVAHELTHVVQQGNQYVQQNKLAVGEPDNPFEQEAEHIASNIVADTSISNLQQMRNPAQIQRVPNDDTNASTNNESTTLSATRFKGNAVLEACFENKRFLKEGDSDKEAIKIIQQALIDAGFPLKTFGVDGKFGKETKVAIEQFQMSVGLTGRSIDGIIGPITMHLLDQHFVHVDPKPQPVKVPTQFDVKTLKPGKVPDSTPEVSTTTTASRDMIPNPSKEGLASLVEITVEVGADIKIFSTGDKINPNKPDPCRSAQVDTQLHTKFKLEGIGIGKRVHILYHEPTWTLTLPGPCSQLPEIKAEIDTVNFEIVPQILVFSLTPVLTFADGQLKPGVGAEVEFKPFGRSNSLIGGLKFTLGGGIDSEKDTNDNNRIIKATIGAGAGIVF